LLDSETTNVPHHDFDHPIFQANEEEEEWEIPHELLSLIEQENKEIKPYEEAIEVINLGMTDDKKEVKIDTTMKEDDHKILINLILECVDVFAWSYQGMLGLDPNIVEHKLPLKPKFPPVK